MKDDFLKKFKPGDNVPENLAFQENTIMEAKASLLIESHFASPTFASVLGNVASAPLSLMASDPAFQFELWKYSVRGREFEFSQPDPRLEEQTSLCLPFNTLEWLEESDRGRLVPCGIGIGDEEVLESVTMASRRRVPLRYFGSAYRALKHVSDLDSPEKVCLHFGQAPEPFAPLKNLREIHQNFFRKLADLVELEKIQPRLPPWFLGTDIIGFDGKHGETFLHVFRFCDNNRKILLPMTMWFRNGSPHPISFFCPGNHPLPVFNMDLLPACGDKRVILTDSLEICAENQGRLENAIWVGYYGDMRYIDWRPLEATPQQIFLFVTNHSGRRLAEAYGTAKKLSEYLLETVGVKKLNYIQLQTDYTADPPKPIPESYREMTQEEFLEMAKRAEDSLKPRSEFWVESVKEVNADNKNLLHVEQQPYRYLLRPFLVEGTTSLIHAPKGVGKSSFGYSIAGALTSIHKAELCPGTWWFAREEPCRVLYLDFENSEAVVSQRLKMFCSRYWGRGDEDNRAGLDNLVIRYGDQFLPCRNYALPENHAMVFRWLDEAENQGHVDLIVIDTYSRFINSQESTKSVAGFTALCNQINQRGTAVLVIHHSGSGGDVRGFKEKRDILYSCVHLTREGGGPADDLYNAPLRVEWENLREPDYNPTQVIKLTEDGWMPDGINDKEALEAFRRQNFVKIVEQYARLGFTDTDMQDMLNTSNGTFYNLKKAIRE